MDLVEFLFKSKAPTWGTGASSALHLQFCHIKT